METAAITYIAGLVIGSIITTIIFRIKILKAGTLKIDTSNDDFDRYSLEIDVPLEKVAQASEISLKIHIL